MKGSVELERAGRVGYRLYPACDIPAAYYRTYFSLLPGGQSRIKKNGTTDLSAHLGAGPSPPPRPIYIA